MAKYTNSPLINYTRISPNKTSPRNHIIDTITIHCVVGQCTVEALGAVFAPATRKGSSNYGIGKDGRIGMYVEEKDRSWCSSNAANDHRAITIEVASDTTHPYAVTDAAYKALIELVTDICKRNNIKKLVWSTNKDDRVNHRNGCNMTVHRDYANKSCPGEYLYSRHDDIANQVNKKLNSTSTSKTICTGKIDGYNIARLTNYLVVYNNKANTGTNIWGTEVAVNSEGIAICTPVYGKGKMVVPAGGYVISGHGTASDWINKNIKKGSKISISNGVIKVGTVVPTTTKLSVGDKVKLVSGAKYSSGASIPSWLFNKILYVRGIRSNGSIVISTLKTGAITGVVAKKYLKKI